MLLRVLYRRLRRMGKKQAKKTRRKTSLAAKARKTARIRAYVRAAKIKPCTDCGNYYPNHMEWDHLSYGPKSRDGFVKLGSWRQVEEELARVQVVCCSCHEAREVSRGGTHGLGKKPCPNLRFRGEPPQPLPVG